MLVMHSKQRRVKSIRSAQSALLQCLWIKLGGNIKVSKLLGINKQTVINWRRRSRVPLIECTTVARKLGLNDTQLYGLNYLELKKFNGPATPPWEEVVKSFVFKRDYEDYLMSLAPPRTTAKNDD